MKASQLRQAILQAAVQGRLVPQNPQDEPASVLMSKISPKSATRQVAEEEKAFPLPTGWEWCRVENVAEHVLGKMLDKQKNTGELAYYLRNKNVQWFSFDLSDLKEMRIKASEFERYAVKKGDLVICEGGYPGTCAIWKDEGTIFFQKALHRVRFHHDVMAEYFQYYLYLSSLDGTLATHYTGSGIQHFTGRSLGNFVYAMPPLAEQHRIVARLNELMLLCDELEAAEKELDALESNLDEYLPKSILQAAVQGKLVPQNIHDEPASVLLERIRAEKTRLIKEGKIKKEKPLPLITEEEIPYGLPDGWEWCRLNELCEYIQRGRSPKYSEIKQLPVLSQKCVQWGGVSLEKAKFIEPDSINAYGEERYVKNGDLLWNSTGHGTLGRIAQVNDINKEYPIVVADSHVTVIRPLHTFVNTDYLLFWFSSPSVQDEIVDKSSGSTNQIELATTTIKNYCVPLPPLDEQQRIVAKVAVLMARCEQLKNIDVSALPPLATIQNPIIPQKQPAIIEPEERYGIAARGEVSEKVSAAHRKARQSVFEDDDA
ncbi:MAG: restriction endonuclease subunit S [Desulfovibrio sp.]|uniref:restriction endonuclease subunit S n=1 Tax=Desulfovibrio sp. TaxID=885 RepID=UPI0025860B55|nr:restriction endonuclease subunit S [Desulfovibrio sp.]MCD7984694.1 restriction endonuclease subunit S [Desulfovibrio sp.]